MPVTDVYVTVLCLLSYLALPLHRCGCEFHVFLLDRKETARKSWSPFTLPPAQVALSSFLKEAGVVLTGGFL